MGGRAPASANGKGTREAVYARVSREEGQEAENQLLVLRGAVERDGHELVGVYVDRESGRKGKRERSEFAQMFKDAERRRFDVLRFWALDRFSREGIRKTLGYLQQLDHLGVRFRSHTEPYLDTSNELLAHIVLGVTAYYAQLEAVRISDRTKAGLARARAGKGDRLPRRLRTVAGRDSGAARRRDPEQGDLPSHRALVQHRQEVHGAYGRGGEAGSLSCGHRQPGRGLAPAGAR